MLGLKFADRTFRFTHLHRLDDGLRLTSAGAGLIPFESKHKGHIRPEGAGRLVDILNRALDRDEVERGEVVVVLDGRCVVRSVLPVSEEIAADSDELRNRIKWEIGNRFNPTVPAGDLYLDWTPRGGIDGVRVVDAWGVYRETLDAYERVVTDVGCSVGAWDCDPWALTRLYHAYLPEGERAELTVLVHVEAESLEVALLGNQLSAGVTVLRSERRGDYLRRWDPDNPEEVAHEVEWCIDRLRSRWWPDSQMPEAEIARVLFTGSVEDTDALLAALVRRLPSRIETMDLRKIFEVEPSLDRSPLIQSNLGSFALCVGGALGMLEKNIS